MGFRKPFRKPYIRPEKQEVTFDTDARNEFISGFRQRRQQRRHKAKEELKELIKKKKKEIRRKALLDLQRKIVIQDQRDCTELSDSDSDLFHEEDCPKDPSKVIDFKDCTVEVSNLQLDPYQDHKSKEKRASSSTGTPKNRSGKLLGKNLKQSMRALSMKAAKEYDLERKKKLASKRKNKKKYTNFK